MAKHHDDKPELPEATAEAREAALNAGGTLGRLVINGTVPDFASVEVEIGESIFTNFLTMSYGRREEGGIGGWFVVPRIEYVRLVAALGEGYAESRFEFSIAYCKSGSAIATDRLTDCLIVSESYIDRRLFCCDISIGSIGMTTEGGG